MVGWGGWVWGWGTEGPDRTPSAGQRQWEMGPRCTTMLGHRDHADTGAARPSRDFEDWQSAARAPGPMRATEMLLSTFAKGQFPSETSTERVWGLL